MLGGFVTDRFTHRPREDAGAARAAHPAIRTTSNAEGHRKDRTAGAAVAVTEKRRSGKVSTVLAPTSGNIRANSTSGNIRANSTSGNIRLRSADKEAVKRRG
jgi:hypothetical protein